MPLQGDTSELRSTGPMLVPFLATTCLYWGVCLTAGQPDPKADQMSSWPDVVLLLVTSCLYQRDTSQLRSTGRILVPVLATRCLYWGVHLTSVHKGHLKLETHFAFHALLHRGLFHERPTSQQYKLYIKDSWKMCLRTIQQTLWWLWPPARIQVCI